MKYLKNYKILKTLKLNINKIFKHLFKKLKFKFKKTMSMPFTASI